MNDASDSGRRGRGKSERPQRGLNNYLKKIGYSQAERAEELGLSDRTISTYDQQDKAMKCKNHNLVMEELEKQLSNTSAGAISFENFEITEIERCTRCDYEHRRKRFRHLPVTARA